MTQDDSKKDGAGNKSSLVKVDPTKSNEQYIKEVEAYYIIPKLVREVFPDLVKLIFETESMDADEREYWLQILPIMTEEQISKFRDILVNEKDQLSKLDQDYEKEMKDIDKKYGKEFNEEEIKARKAELQKQESASEAQEQQTEADLLKQLENL